MGLLESIGYMGWGVREQRRYLQPVEEIGDEEAQQALWAGARESHAAAISAMQSRQAQETEAAMQTNTGGEAKRIEPIRNVGAKVGRNDPCHCGSGKKYKNCHMKLESGKK